MQPGANPTIASYNASAVQIYNFESSLVRLENKSIIFNFEKRLVCYITGAVVVESEVVGLAPGTHVPTLCMYCKQSKAVLSAIHTYRNVATFFQYRFPVRKPSQLR
jgi:hypothetical protein